MKITRLTDGPYGDLREARALSVLATQAATVVRVRPGPESSRCGLKCEPTGLTSGEVPQRGRNAGDL